MRLNGSGIIKSLRLDLSQDVLGETSFVKSLNGTRDVPAMDGHFIALAELVNIALGAVGDIRVLLVKGLLKLGKGLQILESLVSIIANTVTAELATYPNPVF